MSETAERVWEQEQEAERPYLTCSHRNERERAGRRARPCTLKSVPSEVLLPLVRPHLLKVPELPQTEPQRTKYSNI